MKRAALVLALSLVACRKDKPPTPTVVTSASVAPEAPILIPVETTAGARVDVPGGFTVEQDDAYDMTIRIPSGGRIRLVSLGACGRTIEKVCTHGTVLNGTCEEPKARTRVSDGVVHTILFEGDVPPAVLEYSDRWSVRPETRPGGVCGS